MFVSSKIAKRNFRVLVFKRLFNIKQFYTRNISILPLILFFVISISKIKALLDYSFIHHILISPYSYDLSRITCDVSR